MKKIEAMIRPFKLDDVRENLSDIGISDGRNRQKNRRRYTEFAYSEILRYVGI